MTQNRSVQVTFTPSVTFALTINMIGNGYGNIRESIPGAGSPALICVNTGGTISGTCVTQVPATRRPTLLAEGSQTLASQFLGFSGPCSGTGICAFEMTGPVTVTANFRSPAVQIQSGGGTGSGTISGEGINCAVTPTGVSGTCLATYPAPTNPNKTYSATASTNNVFTSWGGACSGNGQCTATAAFAAPTVVTARFDLPSHNLTVTGGGTGGGTVTSVPTRVNCTIANAVTSGTCVGAFSEGTIVTLTAAPGGGSEFSGWSGSCTGAGTCQVTMAAARAVTAGFNRTSAVVSVTGTGSGTVTSTPSGIGCTLSGGAPAGTCSAPFTLGAPVTLAATPASGWQFDGWGGACTGNATCALTMSVDRAVTATFSRPPVTLTILASGSGSGSVQSDPPAIGCTITGTGTSGACASQFAFGTQARLTATPTGGSTFVGWSAPCAAGTAVCTVTLSANTTLTATFNGNLVALSVVSAGTGDGIVRSSIGGMTCRIDKGVKADAGCSAGVQAGAAVTVTADPQNGSTFTGWTGLGCSGSGLTCQVTLAAAGSITARFDGAPPAAELVQALIGSASLSADQRAQLDRFGNNNGRFDLGDLLAQLDRTSETVSPATIQAIRDAERPATRGAGPPSRRDP